MKEVFIADKTVILPGVRQYKFLLHNPDCQRVKIIVDRSLWDDPDKDEVMSLSARWDCGAGIICSIPGNKILDEKKKLINNFEAEISRPQNEHGVINETYLLVTIEAKKSLVTSLSIEEM